MPDAAATSGVESDSGDGVASALTPAAIDAILADFRTWLTDLASGGRRPPEGNDHSPESVDLFALVGQFAALRHEVNMQTRAARTAVEQNAEVLKHLSTLQQPDDFGDTLRPIAKGIIDIADALMLSLRQLEKFRDSSEQVAEEKPAPGFFARLFGTRPVTPPRDLEKPRQQVAAAADGYAMSLRRVERLLPALELEPQSCVGEAFDPETMEAVELKLRITSFIPPQAMQELQQRYGDKFLQLDANERWAVVCAWHYETVTNDSLGKHIETCIWWNFLLHRPAYFFCILFNVLSGSRNAFE